MIAGIILAAGESRRMELPKALLRLGEKTFIEAHIQALRASKIGQVTVVLGYQYQEIVEKVDLGGVILAINEDYYKGQLSSLIKGIEAIRGDTDGIMISLVDHPPPGAHLVDTMVDEFYQKRKTIIIPTYKGRRGHPVVFSRYLLPEILSAPQDQGARAVVRAHPDQVFEIETDEEGVVTDIDTLEDYYNFLARLGGKGSRGPDFLIEIGRI